MNMQGITKLLFITTMTIDSYLNLLLFPQCFQQRKLMTEPNIMHLPIYGINYTHILSSLFSNCLRCAGEL